VLQRGIRAGFIFVLIWHYNAHNVIISHEGESMFFGRSWSEWINQYEQSHQNPINRNCHLIGIPLIVLSILFFVLAIFMPGVWPIPVIMFIVGWIFQFIGHAFEGKPPEFFKDWRFLFVGVRWWLARVSGQV
jgi:uncharacterized membrane protein YGL010W